jgi:hypothetical protein
MPFISAALGRTCSAVYLLHILLDTSQSVHRDSGPQDAQITHPICEEPLSAYGQFRMTMSPACPLPVTLRVHVTAAGPDIIAMGLYSPLRAP